MYAAIGTHPDIARKATTLSRYNTTQLTSYLCTARRVLRYLRGNFHLALKLPTTGEDSISAYADADWATVKTDRRSIGGHCIYSGDALISWTFKTQTVIVISTLRLNLFPAQIQLKRFLDPTPTMGDFQNHQPRNGTS
jgi:hypothetical protein